MNFTFHVPHPIMNSSKWLQSILSYFAGKNFFFLCQTMLNDSLAMRQHFNQFHYFTQYIEVWLLSHSLEFPRGIIRLKGHMSWFKASLVGTSRDIFSKSFRKRKTEVEINRIEDAPEIVVASCVLHDIFLIAGDDVYEFLEDGYDGDDDDDAVGDDEFLPETEGNDKRKIK
ncbi:unnamed protein product [Porites evermanni]|uniref:Uncharacterized protein n=1 Tax=Porites evermanni TaxID=104178 RepID=A0ABN8PJS2_9CNID|nr:unnamed protein product [Porites evermanni]